MRSLWILITLSALFETSAAFSLKLQDRTSRRAFFSNLATTTASAGLAVGVTTSTAPANAAAQVFKLDSGIKYAILKQPADPKKAAVPQQGDIVAVEYTGYLTDGSIFDATHAEGKSNVLLFKLGSTAVIPGLNDMISNMVVGQKVQAIIPPQLAFADKGICIDDGECLVKPGSTLVYDIYLKKSSIPPP